MSLVKLGQSWRQADTAMKKGAKAFKERWPADAWIERVVADDHEFVFINGNEREPWKPDIHDWAADDWCVAWSQSNGART